MRGHPAHRSGSTPGAATRYTLHPARNAYSPRLPPSIITVSADPPWVQLRPACTAGALARARTAQPSREPRARIAREPRTKVPPGALNPGHQPPAAATGPINVASSRATCLAPSPTCQPVKHRPYAAGANCNKASVPLISGSSQGTTFSAGTITGERSWTDATGSTGSRVRIENPSCLTMPPETTGYRHPA